MPITDITYQNKADSLNAAYKPVVFRVKAKIPNATSEKYIPPVVYCDVYIDGIYYKSLTRTMYINNDKTAPEYEFDIQDALQEVMGYNLPQIDGDKILQFNNTIKRVFVKFRNAFLDENGFTTSEQKVPVQGTNSTEPQPGGGTESNTFFVLNSTIQHEENQDLENLLNSYKTDKWRSNIQPLTKKPKSVYLRKTDSSYFPIVSEIFPAYICIEAKYIDGTTHVDCTEIDNGSDLKVNAGEDKVFSFDYIKYRIPWLIRIRITNTNNIFTVKFIDYYYPEESNNAEINVNTTKKDFSYPITNPNIIFNRDDVNVPVQVFNKIRCIVNGKNLQSNTIAFGGLPENGHSNEYSSNNTIIEEQEKIPISGNITGNYSSFHWIIIEKPEGSYAVIDNKNSLDTSLIPDLFGTYKLRLNAYNDKEILSYDDVIIQINKS